MRFSLFDSHLDLAHHHWTQLIGNRLSDTSACLTVDATCGNGHDSLVLANITLNHPDSRLVLCDIQPSAITATRKHLHAHLSPSQMTCIEFLQQDHADLYHRFIDKSVDLVVFNLGYLPGGDKTLTTSSERTLASVTSLLSVIRLGGAISITCYPGHPEGALEEAKLVEFAGKLPPDEWSCCHHRWLNRRKAPSLLLLQKELHQSKNNFHRRQEAPRDATVVPV